MIAVLEKLADSGLGHDNKVIRQTRRHALQSIHSAKVRLHERRRKFVQALDDAADDFNRRHLSKESLQRLCRRIGFEYDNSLTQRRREQYIDETRFAWWRAGWEAQGHACDFSELLVFKCPELGLEIGLRDYGAKPSATANITRGHTLLEIRCTSREEPQTVSVYTPCPRGLDGRPRTIADYARILDSNRVPACARESIHVLTEQDPEERARNLAVEIKYIETCRALSQLLPICPRFGKKGEWYGEAWNRELDNLASAIRDEQPLSLVRLRYKHGDEENRVVSQPAAGEAYGAASLTRLAEFRWNIDVESPADRATDLA